LLEEFESLSNDRTYPGKEQFTVKAETLHRH
jgi:hypothetical protein